MCFSATANFVGSGVLGTLGVVTITKVKHRRELLFGCIPLLFAIHQFTEGFVWLGLDGTLSTIVAHDAGAAFMLYAQGLLPFLLPLSVLLFEPTRSRRRFMLPFVIVGGGLALYVLWALAAFPTQVAIEQNSISYINPATHYRVLAVLYVMVTCGPLFFSRIRMMVLFGAANLIILILTMLLREYAFTSVWCAYAAVASLMIWAGFRSTDAERPYSYTKDLRV
ncbi:MAG: DUF6629 family protein [Bryocella sp.]